jgi:hypothetical protein
VHLLPPRIGAARADPAVVRRVRAEDAAAERAHQEARRGEARLEEEMRQPARRGLEAARVDAGRADLEGEAAAALP